jgi:hypothetical protein
VGCRGIGALDSEDPLAGEAVVKARPVKRHSSFCEQMSQIGIAVLIPLTKAQREKMLTMLQTVIAKWRNRIETSSVRLPMYEVGLSRRAHIFGR